MCHSASTTANTPAQAEETALTSASFQQIDASLGSHHTRGGKKGVLKTQQGSFRMWSHPRCRLTSDGGAENVLHDAK
eukprot:CAMPEP_0185009360 /NCGR_PEP_ID=MMETSP1098-20130426/91935_1 /TAXON_ID=89044 /ORGANISM="Spumella elongata, Strain CCAP 955/1" /LENGTH=76 /DNA_ID=CAMNT_0027538025 /DNA_START=68 /DNA_END=297 /DNA_ORIENTATION=+